MSVRSSEIGGEITRQRGDVHRAQFFGSDMPAEASGSAITRVSRVDVRGDTRLAQRDAMHTDPQVLFAGRSSNQIMLAKEPA